MPSFKSGTLWPLVVHRTQEALRCGALQPIATLSERVEQAGVRFIIRMISSPQRKQKERSENPFLPFDEALFVSEISDTHVCLLNRFNVIEHHLLFVTRYFEDQELPPHKTTWRSYSRRCERSTGLPFTILVVSPAPANHTDIYSWFLFRSYPKTGCQ